MKKIMITGLIFCLCFSWSTYDLMAETSPVSYCVISFEDGLVIEEKQMHHMQSVASISKIMTAILAIEEGNIEDIWTIGKEINTAYGSSIYLKEGQTVSLKTMLYGLMLRSGNDAAVTIATHIYGSEEAFVQKMNQKANELGMMDTSFENVSGLDEEGNGNLSSTYDIALLMRYALTNPTFREITQSKYYTSEWNHRWKNKNRLLFSYDKTTGGKTGFTKKAGRTLVTSAKQGNMETIVVTFDYGDDFNFHQIKHEEAFQNYHVELIVEAQSFMIQKKQIIIDKPIYITQSMKHPDAIFIRSHIEDKEWILEIRQKDHTQVYRYLMKARDSK